MVVVLFCHADLLLGEHVLFLSAQAGLHTASLIVSSCSSIVCSFYEVFSGETLSMGICGIRVSILTTAGSCFCASLTVLALFLSVSEDLCAVVSHRFHNSWFMLHCGWSCRSWTIRFGGTRRSGGLYFWSCHRVSSAFHSFWVLPDYLPNILLSVDADWRKEYVFLVVGLGPQRLNLSHARWRSIVVLFFRTDLVRCWLKVYWSLSCLL